MLNIKLTQYLGVSSLLFVALGAYHDERAWLAVCVFGILFSILWFFSMGRTVAFRTHWRGKIQSRDPALLPAKLPWYAAWVSTAVALLLPVIGAFFWLVFLVARLAKYAA